jgi:outer membrane protein insertion porin family
VGYRTVRGRGHSRLGHGNLVLDVREAPIIHAIHYEGTTVLKRDRIRDYSSMREGQIFSRAAALKQTARLIEMYRQLGFFATTVEPLVVQLADNEVDLVFKIEEGVESYIRAINILANNHYSDAEIKGVFATKVTSLRHVRSNSSRYDPDRLAEDQARLHQFYLSRGFPDFRVVSAVAELTPDRRDFVLTYLVDEGARRK